MAPEQRGPEPPGESGQLVGASRDPGERNYHVNNHQGGKALHLLAAIKPPWRCEQGHQQLKEELGLGHFKGRTWRRLHHCGTMTLIGSAFLRHLLPKDVCSRGANEDEPRCSTAAIAASDPLRPARPHMRRLSARCLMQQAADSAAVRVSVDVAKQCWGLLRPT